MGPSQVLAAQIRREAANRRQSEETAWIFLWQFWVREGEEIWLSLQRVRQARWLMCRTPMHVPAVLLLGQEWLKGVVPIEM